MVRTDIGVILVIAFCGLWVLPAEAGNRGGTSGVCEDGGLIGAAYAACNVYCEALDCDSDVPNGSERACQNALARFEDLTDGSLPPCHAPEEGMTCPCSAAWHADGFFPEYLDPGASNCSGTTGSDEGGSLFLSVFEVSGESASYASIDFMRFSDPENPSEYVGCSSLRLPYVPGSADTGSFDMMNSFSPAVPGVHELQQAIFDACQADLLDLMDEFVDRFGGACEIVDLSAE